MALSDLLNNLKNKFIRRDKMIISKLFQECTETTQSTIFEGELILIILLITAEEAETASKKLQKKYQEKSQDR